MTTRITKSELRTLIKEAISKELKEQKVDVKIPKSLWKGQDNSKSASNRRLVDELTQHISWFTENDLINNLSTLRTLMKVVNNNKPKTPDDIKQIIELSAKFASFLHAQANVIERLSSDLNEY